MLKVTSRAEALFDPDGLRRAAVPLSDTGRRARGDLKPMGPSDREAWESERRSCLALDGACRRASDLMPSASAALARLERIDGTAQRFTLPQAVEVPDLFRLKGYLFSAHLLVNLLAETGALTGYERPPVSVDKLEDWVRSMDAERALNSRFQLADGFHERLGAVRASFAALERRVRAGLEGAQRSTEQRLSVAFANGRVRVAIPSERAEELRADPELTLVAATAFELEFELRRPLDVVAVEAQMVAAEAEVADVERQVLTTIATPFASRIERILRLDAWLGRLDLRLAKLRLAEAWPSWPETGATLEVEGGWVPAVRDATISNGGVYQPIDVAAPPGLTVVAGPNMGGKTVTLALLASVQYLAQLGYPAPALRVRFPWLDRIDYVGGELGSVSSGLSSFAGEMAALAEALAAPGDALLLIDELGRATDPRDGQAIAIATATHLAKLPSVSVLVSHFEGVGRGVAQQRYRVAGLRPDAAATLREDSAARGWKAAVNSAMDYRLVTDQQDGRGSSALVVAGLFALPVALLEDAARLSEARDDDEPEPRT